MISKYHIRTLSLHPKTPDRKDIFMAQHASSMPPPRIVILGAGLSGLSFARTLASRSIPAVIYDKSPAPTTTPRHGYGLALQNNPTYDFLCNLIYSSSSLNTNGERATQPAEAHTLLTSANAPSDWLQRRRDDSSSSNAKGSKSTVRLHRARLEDALSQTLPIKWEHKVTDIKPRSSPDTAVNICFANGSTATADLVIDAEGIHSLTRHTLLPNTKADILPFVVFRGKRTITLRQWEALGGEATEEAVHVTQSGERLEVKIDEWTGEDEVEISYTYSRAAYTERDDPLHKPDRGLDDAKVIPTELSEELESLKDIPDGFAAIFSADNVREDRLLHWLMRTQTLPNEDELRDLAEKGIMFIGESARAKPILGGRGGDTAIADGHELGTFMADNYNQPSRHIAGFYSTKYWRSYADVSESQKALTAMHQSSA